MKKIKILPMEDEKYISQFIEQKFEEDNLKAIFPNELLREQVLELLDRYCIPIYYPLEANERNNGFHITNIPFADGRKNHFVFINTAQTLEKQAITAAHELGHIWKVDEYLSQKTGKIYSCEEDREAVISRFAAVLLMPKDIFEPFVHEILKSIIDKECKENSGSIEFFSALNLIVVIMNKFFVPMKAVVLRLLEVEIIDENVANILLGKDKISENEIQKIIDYLIDKLGFINLKKNTPKKWIKGLSDLLDKAEKDCLVNQNKIDNIRKKFDLDKHSLIETREVIKLNTRKGKKDNAN